MRRSSWDSLSSAMEDSVPRNRTWHGVSHSWPTDRREIDRDSSNHNSTISEAVFQEAHPISYGNKSSNNLQYVLQETLPLSDVQTQPLDLDIAQRRKDVGPREDTSPSETRSNEPSFEIVQAAQGAPLSRCPPSSTSSMLSSAGLRVDWKKLSFSMHPRTILYHH